jgi:K+-transporting ATPase ATPase C chain
VQSRIDTLLKYHPEITKSDIPVDLVTASGSGLDPHISKKGALIQVNRVARARGLETEVLNSLIDAHTEKPLLGLFGPSDQVNVLQLNLALDELGTAK